MVCEELEAGVEGGLVACFNTNLTIICAIATITSPIMAYRMVSLALFTLAGSPAEVMYFRPLIISIITAATPTTTEIMFMTTAIFVFTLEVAVRASQFPVPLIYCSTPSQAACLEPSNKEALA